MAQPRPMERSLAGIALISVLCSMLSSALFSGLFSGRVSGNGGVGVDDQMRGRPPSAHLRFELPRSSDVAVQSLPHGRRARESGMIYACGGRNGIARFVEGEEECHQKEEFYSWTVGSSLEEPEGERGCTVTKEGDVAEIACGETSAQITDGTDGAQGPPGTGCSVTKNAAGVSTIACGADSAVISDGADGQDGEGCTVFKTGGVASISCGSYLVEVRDGVPGPAGAGCTVSKTGETATVTCGTSSVLINDGADGSDGIAGADGAGCVVSKSDGVATVWCGQSAAQIADGAAGPAGEGCSVSKHGGVAAINCGGDVVEVRDGLDGADGKVGPAFTGGIVALDGVSATYGGTFRSTEPTGAGAKLDLTQPSLGVNFIIRYRADEGAVASTHVGEIRMYAGAFPPEGWLLCDGSWYKLRDAAYNPLYQVIRGNYNPPGIEVGSFAVPDLRGRVALGAGAVDSTVQVVGLGDGVGSYRTALTEENLPEHRHALAEVSSLMATASAEAAS